MKTMPKPLSKPELFIDVLPCRKAALKIRALKHKLRQEILQLIHKHESMQVTAIYKKLKLEQSVASQHLAILRKSNFVVTKREGKFIYYSVNYNQINEFQEQLKKLFAS
jgi:ArsR family transcriptional regulator, virulence genes transcriptional regulator